MRSKSSVDRRLAALLVPLLLGAALAEGSGTGVSPRVAFVTSMSGSGNLNTWAPGVAGLAAADAVCRGLAAVAQLSNPEDFVAWLSDSQNDAYCRVHGRAGKRSANCGLAELPSNAGPWVRTDGFPWAADIVHMLGLSGEIVTPPLLDEYGTPLPSYLGYFTATLGDGTYDAYWGACVDWTSSASATVTIGNARGTTGIWTSGTTSLCTGSWRLLCLQTGPGAPLPPRASGGALAFVTTATGNGDLSQWLEAGGHSGLAAGDNVCRLRALAAGLPAPDSFVAFLSHDGVVDARDRLTLGGPWIRTDGVEIASSAADLLDGSLFSSLNVDEFGVFHTSENSWTGSSSDGTATSSDCAGWTVDTASGTYGRVNNVSPWWMEVTDFTCAANFHLYCFSNLATVIFTDDLESAGATAWTMSVP